MNNNKKSACWIGLHAEEIHKEIPLTDIRGNEIGVVIVNRCTNCGTIKQKKIRTVELQH